MNNPVVLVRAKAENYNEAYQSTKTKFSLVAKQKEGFHELHSPVQCRDFLGDAVYSQATGEEVCIYEFYWGKDRSKIDNDELRLSIHFASKDTKSRFFNNAVILTEVEKYANVKPSTIHLVKDKDNCIVIEADRIWQSSTMLISLYTYILKIMGYPFKNPEKWMDELPNMDYNDSGYFAGQENELKAIILNVGKFAHPKLFSGWKNPQSGTIHSSSGFSSVVKYYRTEGYKSNSNAVLLRKLMK